MSYLGKPGSNKIITTDASGKLVPGVVGSGMSLTAGTLTAGVTVVFDCDFTLLSNQSITGSTIITDQSSRSLTFTPSFVGTASMAIVNGSGLGLTTASNLSRSRIFSTFNGFGRLPFFGKGYRIWLRWANYSPLSTTQSLYTGMTVEPSSGGQTYTPAVFRVNNGGGYPYVGWYGQNFPDGDWTTGSPNSNNVQVLEQRGGMITAMYGFSAAATGFPNYTSLKILGSGRSRSLSSGNWFNIDASAYGFEFQFANAFDSVARTMYCTNLRVEVMP